MELCKHWSKLKNHFVFITLFVYISRPLLMLQIKGSLQSVALHNVSSIVWLQFSCARLIERIHIEYY